MPEPATTPKLTLTPSELEALVASFEDGTIDNCQFSHPEHIYVIWSLVRSRGTLGGIAQFETCLKRITEAEGHPEKYHATITHALGIIVGERVAAQPELDWPSFMDANGDLFAWPVAYWPTSTRTVSSTHPRPEVGSSYRPPKSIFVMVD